MQTATTDCPLTEDETSIVQGIILAAALFLLPLILFLSDRYEKKKAYIIAAGTWVFVMVALFFVPQGIKLPIYIIAALAGFGVSAAHVIPTAMSPDALEVDELMSGQRQEGAYAGIEVFITKLARMVVLAILPIILKWANYIQPTANNPFPSQPQSALLALRVFVSIVPAILLIFSLIVANRYTITRARYAEIEQELKTKRQEQSG